MSEMSALIISSGVNHFGRVDESPDEIFEAASPGWADFGGWRVTGAGRFNFVASDFVGNGVEMVIPTHITRRAGFLRGCCRIERSAPCFVTGSDLGEINFAFLDCWFAGEEAEEEMVEEHFR